MPENSENGSGSQIPPNGRNLRDVNVLVTGGSRGLGASIVRLFAEEGANVAINYITSEKEAKELEKSVNGFGNTVTTVQGDVSRREDCERIVKETLEVLHGIDVLISNAGWTKITQFGDLDSMSEDEWDKCWATNCKANLHLFRAALPYLKKPDSRNIISNGAFIVTSSVAGLTANGSSMAYSVSKAAGLHLVKCLASTQGPEVRVNAISPGLLLTEWGQRFPAESIQMVKDKSYLKRETDIDDCAKMFVAVAKNRSLTGQNIQIDSGLAMLGKA